MLTNRAYEKSDSLKSFGEAAKSLHSGRPLPQFNYFIQQGCWRQILNQRLDDKESRLPRRARMWSKIWWPISWI